MIKQISRQHDSAHKSVAYVSKFLAFTLLCFGSVQSVVNAGPNLLITPTRVVFEERTRTAQVTLMNNGTDTGNYRISFINQNMTEDGKFEPVAEGEKGNFSSSMVRYSPRQITLPAGQSQIVRLMLRKPKDLENGEYRSHMLFQSLPKPNKSNIETTNEKQDAITVEIIPIVGISIPVIVRKGDITNKLTLSDPTIIKGDKENPTSRLKVTMHREGNGSVYGDFRITHTPNNGLPTVIGLSNGVAIYTPNTLRQYEIPLTVSPDIDITDGIIDIAYLEAGKNIENGLIAKTSFALK